MFWGLTRRFLNAEPDLLKRQTCPQAAEAPALTSCAITLSKSVFFFLCGYFKSLLCENFKQFGQSVAHAVLLCLSLFFFQWGIVWKVLAGWVRCDGIPQHSGIPRVCAFVCALVIISPFSCFFDVWIKWFPAFNVPLLHLHISISTLLFYGFPRGFGANSFTTYCSLLSVGFAVFCLIIPPEAAPQSLVCYCCLTNGFLFCY